MGLEDFENTSNGNGDRFADRYLGEVLLDRRGRQTSFYTVRGNGRWSINDGGTAGDLERRCRLLLNDMKTRATALSAQGEAEDNEVLCKQGEALQKWSHASSNLPAMRLMAETACLTYGMTCEAESDFDNALDVLATPSELLMLTKDGIQRRPIEPQDRITLSTAVEWKPELLYDEQGQAAPVPALVEQYFQTFIPEPGRVALIFKALGSALLGGNPGRLLLVIKGQTTNGKTQLVEALRAALGSYAGAGNPSMFRGNLDDKPRPDVISVLKKRVVFLAEASKNWELHGDRVKAITGGDAVKVRKMRSDDFLETVPHFMPVFYANEMPRISGADPALKRRILAMEFKHQPKVEDPTIKTAFLSSLDVREYLFALLVDGCLRAMQEGLEDVKDEFSAFTVSSFDDTTHLGEFFEYLRDANLLEVLDAEQQAQYGIKSTYVKVKAMHERYKTWVEIHGNKQDKTDVLNYKEFNAQLRDNYGWESENVGGLRWVGKRLKDLVHTS